VILRVVIGNAKTDRHDVKKGRSGYPLTGSKIVADMKAQLVSAGGKFGALKDGLVEPPVGVGVTGRNLNGATIHPPELDGQARRWLADRGIEDVCCQPPH